MVRVTFAGAGVSSLASEHPAASVRLLVPSRGASGLVLPTWTGNEYLLADGTRPALRTFTPCRVDGDAGELDLEIVLHGDGVVSRWAAGAAPGAPAAVSGPGRGYAVDDDAAAFLLAGDESAIPAIGQVLAVLPRKCPVQVLIEVAEPGGRLDLPAHPRGAIEWLDAVPGAPVGDALVAALIQAPLVEGVRVWAAGEAAAMQRIRRYLLEDRRLPRAQTWVRGYWKHGRAGDADDDDRPGG